MEGLRCCSISESIQKYSILVWNAGAFCGKCHRPKLKSQGVVMVIHNGFKSEPCKTIHYTYNETLEWLRCCEGLEWIHNYSIMVWNVGALYQTCHHLRLKSRGVMWWWLYLMNSDLNLSQIICYTYNETLEWLRCCGLPELVQVTQSWCEKWNTGKASFNTCHEPKRSP